MTKSLNDETPINYSPLSGAIWRQTYTGAEDYRGRNEGSVWYYNPWTGKARDPRDVESDPFGLLIVADSAAPLKAAHTRGPDEMNDVLRLPVVFKEFTPGAELPAGPHDLVDVFLENGSVLYGTLARLVDWTDKSSTRVRGWRRHTGDSPSPKLRPFRVVSEEAAGHPLFDVLLDAIKQAMHGKGERHGGAATPFLEQQWVSLANTHGTGFLTGQAVKKLNEAAGGKSGDEYEREVLGAIVYAGMAILHARGRK